MHACDKIKRLVGEDPSLAATVDAISQQLRNKQ
jgi:hypothetical protein